MRKTTVLFLLTFLVNSMFAQTLEDARKQINTENYFKAKQILYKLLKDGNSSINEVAYYLGNAYLKSDDPDSAKVFYKIAWNPDSKSPLGYIANGRLALLNRNQAEAKVNFDRATQITKMKNADVFFEIGDAYFKPEVINLNAAISNFESAYNLDNKDCFIMLALGDAYLENSVNDNTMGGKAMNKYEASAETCKDLPLAWIKQGRLAVRGRIYDQAIEAYNKALAIDQSYPIVYKELAEAYYLSKQYDKVKPNYEKYIALSPGDNQAKTSLITLYFQSKEYDKAIEEATKGLKNDPSNFVFQRVIAFSNYELKRYAEAAEASKAFWNNPNKKVKDIDIIYSARIAAQTGDTTGAMKLFEQALANDSANCDLLAEFAKVLFQAKHYDEAAQKYVEKKDHCGGLSSLDLYYQGRSYYSAGDSMMADTTFAEFIARNPTSPDGWYWRATINLKIGKAEDFSAYPYYLKYTEIAGADPGKYKRNLTDAYAYLGIYNFEKTKDKEAAKSYFTKALELDPENEIAVEYMKQFN